MCLQAIKIYIFRSFSSCSIGTGYSANLLGTFYSSTTNISIFFIHICIQQAHNIEFYLLERRSRGAHPTSRFWNELRQIVRRRTIAVNTKLYHISTPFKFAFSRTFSCTVLSSLAFSTFYDNSYHRLAECYKAFNVIYSDIRISSFYHRLLVTLSTIQ